MCNAVHAPSYACLTFQPVSILIRADVISYNVTCPGKSGLQRRLVVYTPPYDENGVVSFQPLFCLRLVDCTCIHACQMEIWSATNANMRRARQQIMCMIMRRDNINSNLIIAQEDVLYTPKTYEVCKKSDNVW